MVSGPCSCEKVNFLCSEQIKNVLSDLSLHKLPFSLRKTVPTVLPSILGINNYGQ